MYGFGLCIKLFSINQYLILETLCNNMQQLHRLSYKKKKKHKTVGRRLGLDLCSLSIKGLNTL